MSGFRDLDPASRGSLLGRLGDDGIMGEIARFGTWRRGV